MDDVIASHSVLKRSIEEKKIENQKRWVAKSRQ